MKCNVCGSKKGVCGQGQTKRSFFHIRFASDLKKHLIVPCYAVKKLNSVTDDTLYVETQDGEKYAFTILKSRDKTCIFGAEYQKFLKHYDMEHGEQMRLDMNNKPPYLFMHPLDKIGCDKPRVDEVFEFNNTARAIVLGQDLGLGLSSVEVARINKIVRNRGLGLGGVFVHILTKSDVESNNMHIPKFIVSVLGIARSGKVRFVSDENGVNETGDYFTSTDGRIRFRTGWMDFAKNNKLGIGKVVLMLFANSRHGVRISVDDIRY